MAQSVKRLPAMRETWVRFLGGEDPLEKEVAIHSSTLAWKIPWMEESDMDQTEAEDIPISYVLFRTAHNSDSFNNGPLY